MVWRAKLQNSVLNFTAAAALGLTLPALVPATALADACFVEPAKLSDQAVQSFLSNPRALLQANPVGGYALTTQARALAGSDTATVDELISLAAGATPEQMAAIVAGLAQAATACVNTRPDIAEMIQQALAASGDEKMIAAFAAASGNTQTAAIGTGAVGGGTVGGVGGATGGGVGGIGGTTGGAGSSGATTANTFSNGSTSLSANGGAGSIGTTVESVSPSQ